MTRRFFARVAALAAGIPAFFFTAPAHASSAGLWDLFWNIIVPGLGTW